MPTADGEYGDAFWKEVEASFETPDDFKTKVVKDLEVIALVGALMMTIALGVHLSEDWIEDASPWLRVGYLMSTFLSISFSMMGTLLASRSIVMVNLQPADKCAAMLAFTDGQRIFKQLYPFNLIKLGTVSLVCSPCFLVAAKYSTSELALVITMMTLMVFYMAWEDHNHNIAANIERRGSYALES